MQNNLQEAEKMLIIKDDDSKSVVNLGADEKTQDDQEAIVEQIWSDLRGQASRSDIRRVLIEVAPKYENALIKTYVPIFLYRDVRERLLGSI
jgi:cAMP phosphodiesterase